MIKSKQIGFIGCGNLAQAIMKSIFTSGTIDSANVAVTNRSERKLNNVRNNFGVKTFKSNDDLIDFSDIVVVAVKPQDFMEAIEPFVANFREDQIVISLAAGVSLESLSHLISTTKRLVRVMTNTPAAISRGVVGYCHNGLGETVNSVVEDLFKPLGRVFHLKQEEEFEAFMVGVCSGVGFVYEIMIYWVEWLEQYGIDRSDAQAMILDTFHGTTLLAKNSPNLPLSDLQAKVVSKKGVTQAGLEAFNEYELERVLRVSFEKALLRNKELEKYVGP